MTTIDPTQIAGIVHGHAQIDWDEHGNPHSRVFSDVYFSTESGLDETRHVFLTQNELPERFAALPG
jgi:tRNA 5-methylaminomethyl-2-thiouridine biosynthesis bifunctional protein